MLYRLQKSILESKITKKGIRTMKIIMTAVLSIMASCALALTETIDGVTWTYQNGKLGQPDYRSKGERPAPAHEGTLPSVLKLPRVSILELVG